MRLNRIALIAVVTAAVLPFLTGADEAAQGKELFDKRCTGCHSLDRDMEGPHLRGVYGRRSGSVHGFPYSDALKKTELTWDADTLDRWLTDPEKFLPQNDMAFRVEKPEERREIIQYLQQVSENAR